MARIRRNYAHKKQLGTSPVDVVPLVSAGVQASVSKCSFYNGSPTENRTVTIYVVESGGTAGALNVLVVKAISPGKSWNVVEILTEVITAGMTVQASQDLGADVNVNCSGDDFS